MADPLELYIVPNCGLKIQLYDRQAKPTNGSVPLNISAKQAGRKYKICNTKVVPFKEKGLQESYDGWMSPITPVTLPLEVKKEAGIPEKATKFAYLFAPEGLATSINWSEVRLFPNEINEQSLKRQDEWAIPMLAIMGGFAYFDENNNVLCVNAISLLPTKYKIVFSGPFNTVQEVREDLQSLNRVHPMTMSSFYEGNYVALGWVNPSETFGAKTVAKDCPLDNSGGAFILYRDNGTALAYILDNLGYHDPTGLKSTIAPAFEAMAQAATGFQSGQSFKESSIVSHAGNLLLSPEQKVKMWRIIKSINSKEKIKEFNESNLADDPNTILHLACRTKCGTDVIEKLIDLGEQENLLHKDNYGWIPLLYACRYNPDNLDLIKLFVKKEPTSIEEKDNFNRFPLHVAIDGGCSIEIISYLLKKNPQISRRIVLQPTLLLGRLPVS